MKRDIYIFRHGETDYNADGRVQGWLDIPLNDNGRMQAELLAKKLSTVKFDCIYSSTLSRALDTAKIVTKDTKIITDDGLKEWNVGVFSGKIINVIDIPIDTPIDIDNDIVNVPLAMMSCYDYIPDGGESYNMFKNRVCDTFNKIINNTNAKTIGISTHRGVMQILINQFTELKCPKHYVIPNAEYLRLQWDGEKFTIQNQPKWLNK